MECKNHAAKNYSKALHEAKKDRNVDIKIWKLINNEIIDQLRKICQIIISFHSLERDLKKMISDLRNSPLHVFGNHTNCAAYYCTTIGHISQNFEETNKTGILTLVSG